jgi:aspartyl aminopeptidase
LAIHLDREANSKRTVNPQTDIPPLISIPADDQQPDFRSLLLTQLIAEHPDCGATKVLDYELGFYDVQPASLVGLNEDFIASARLDNLLSCFIGMEALIDSGDEVSSLLVCNDHEEVGSQSAVGAQGPMLKSVIERLAGTPEQRIGLIERSFLVSMDNAHGIHPNYAQCHDEKHGPKLNGGPVIKINANQRYASNSETSSLFKILCEQNSVPVQSFVVRSDMGCGSTIGPITAAELGVKTLDIGVPTFAMHSIRELAGSRDTEYLYTAINSFFKWQQPLGVTQ